MTKLTRFLSIIVLTIYAPAELTRLIIDWGSKYGWGAELIFELPFIWVLYIGAMIVIYKMP